MEYLSALTYGVAHLCRSPVCYLTILYLAWMPNFLSMKPTRFDTFLFTTLTSRRNITWTMSHDRNQSHYTKAYPRLTGRRTCHTDIPSSNGGVSITKLQIWRFAKTTVTYKSLHWFAPLTSHTKLLTRRRTKTSDVIKAIIVARRSDEASVPTQRRFTLVRARFATVRASLHPRTSESPGTFKYMKRLHIKWPQVHQPISVQRRGQL
jgi:hypothetical protein